MHTMKPRMSRRAAVAAALVLAVVAAPLSPSGAAVENVNFTASGGQITFAGQTAAIPPGGVLSGQWDPTSGSFNGSLSVGVLNLPVDASLANLGTINLTFDVRPGPVSGTIPADGSTGTLSSDFNVTIIGTEPLAFSCSLGPISFNLAASLSGGTLSATQSGFTVPPVPVTETCGVATLANGLLGLPSTDSFAELSFTQGPSSPAGPAAVPQVTGQPLFTG